MSLLSIRDYPSVGLNIDINPMDLPPNAITHSNNVRLMAGGVTPFGGHINLTDIPSGKIPQYIKFISTKLGDYWLVALSNSVELYAAGFTDASPASMPTISDESGWSCAMLSDIPVLNHPVLGPHFIDQKNPKFTMLPWDKNSKWDPAKNACDFIASHKQYLFALGLTIDGVYYPDGVRWSAPADIGTVPASWDEMDTANVAGLTTLGGRGGKIVTGKSLRDAFVVYREHGITVFDYVGGIYVWRIRHLSSDVGCLAKNAVVDVNGTHYFISDGDIHLNDGNTIKSIANDRVRTRMSLLNAEHYKNSVVEHRPTTKEVWFCFPTASDQYPGFALIYNYEYDSWVSRDTPPIISLGYGTIPSTSAVWDNSHDTWDNTPTSWDDNATSPFNSSIVGCIIKDGEYQLAVLDSQIGFSREPYSSIIERTDLLFSQISQVQTITRVYPHMVGASKATFQIGSQMYPGGPVTWKPAIDFEPDAQRKIDVRSTGVLHAYRITVESVSSNFILTGLDIEYVEAGLR